ncbi:MAG TPA: 16S rRNA (uracil(1498)-N(3))-methyltransferase, partial [Armatimonadota bacterium]|nr:16S rRNA (uracil(1498)-N(3))-methyltransferase [Armatimonadota bacterium]
MHRFFIEPGQVCGDEVTLSPEQAHQIARVLRLSSGARICILDGRGRESEAVLMEISPRCATARAVEWRPAAGEPRAHVALALGLLKGEK